MTAIAHFLPSQYGGAAAPGLPDRGAAGTSFERVADAWRREMERQQQQSWFLPTLPPAVGLPWATTPALHAELGTASAAVAQTPDSFDQPLRAAEPASPTRSSTLADQAIQAPDVSRKMSSSEGPAVGATVAQTASNTRTVDREQQLPQVEGSVHEGVSAHPNLGPGHDPTALKAPSRVLVDQGQSGLVGTAGAAGTSRDIAAQLQGVLDLGMASLTLAPLDQSPGSPLGAWATATSLADRAAMPAELSEEPTEPVRAATPASWASHNLAPPLRVHCDWQGGQLTVWIGHDRGHADAAALLVQAVERWLTTQRLPSAGFVVNGASFRREAPNRTESRAASVLAAATSDADALVDPQPAGSPDPVFHSVHTLRENT